MKVRASKQTMIDGAVNRLEVELEGLTSQEALSLAFDLMYSELDVEVDVDEHV